MDPARAARFPFIPAAAPPPTIVRTEGVWLIRDDGSRILDAGAGAVVTNIGHGRPEVAEAAARAIAQVDYVVPLWATENRVALVEELTGHWLPNGFSRASFFSGGSESVDAAVRTARMYHLSVGQPDRWKVIGRDVSYHGSTLSGLSVGGHDRRRAGLEPLLHDHPKSGWLDPDSLAKVIEQEGAETVSCFIGEPINGASGGAMVPPDGYWTRVEEVCRANGVLLIVDEVMTGLGRLGRRWGHEHFGIDPDIIVGGKGLSGGYAPMGGMYATDVVTDAIAEAGNGLMYFTFSGADLACAVSLEVLRIMRREGLVERAATMGALLRRRLEETLGDHPNVVDIRGLGLLQGVELVADRDSGRPFPRAADFAAAVAGAGLERGLWVYPCGSGPVQDALLVAPPFTITADEVDVVVDTLAESITAAAARVSAAG
jgi:adenosylmethionine-8-amino-7-oxononanoate aminotransferase